MDFTRHFAKRTKNMKPSAIREVLKLTQKSDIISFAGGLPAPGLFPVDAIKQAADTVLSTKGAAALQYSTTEGYAPLRNYVASRMQGVSADNVQITSGSQQGLDLVAKVLFDPGDYVAVGAPTYMGALRAFDAYEVRYLSVDCDEQGMIPESLETALKQGVKLIYVIPNFDNPTGVTMSLARREALVSLARQYQVPVYEDDPYGELRFEGESSPSLHALAPELVIYGGTFSKIMVPGFRLGWLIAQEALLVPIVRAKQAADLHTTIFNQMIAYEISKDGFMEEQIKKVRHYYHQQRDLMLHALESYFPEGVHWTRPSGGMFLWVTLPAHVNASEMVYDAVEQQVAYVPGEPFFTDGQGLNTFRLSYSVATPEQIDVGMKRLGDVIARHVRAVAAD